mgnify:CR=1 FL=1|tara:strand:- start:32 stop:541 length:510 start_codon:yes stop_codon:yes gene_type:complete
MSKENKIDFIPIVRAIVKLSSALSDADTVIEGKYYKFGLKKTLNQWVDKIEKATKPFMGKFLENSEEALQAAYDRFLELTEDLNIKDEDKTALILLYCKAKSSLNDMEKLTFEEGGMITHILVKYTTEMLKSIEGQYGDIFEIRDSDGKSIQAIIEGYDELGNAMFIKD